MYVKNHRFSTCTVDVARWRGGRPISSSGSVLILALWVVFFLAAITVAVGSHVSATLQAAERLTSRTHARMLAAAGAAQAAAVVMNAISQTNQWDGLTEKSWTRNGDFFRDVPLGEGSFSVVFTVQEETGSVTNYGVLGEEGKINLNKAQSNVLSALFVKVCDMGTADAVALSDAIIAWRSGDYEILTEGAEDGYYSAMEPAYSSANGALRSVEELLLVKGVDASLFERVRPFVTVYGSGLVNINSASEVILEVLGQVAGDDQGGSATLLAAKIGRFRKAGNAFDRAEYEVMRTQLNAFEVLTGEEGRTFSTMISLLAVRSSAYSGVAFAGSLDGEEAPELKVEFVWDADRCEYAWWRERGVAPRVSRIDRERVHGKTKHKK